MATVQHARPDAAAVEQAGDSCAQGLDRRNPQSL